MADKITKASVHYRLGSEPRHCGNCSMYAEHKCSLVSGVIDPAFVCDRWDAKDKKAKSAMRQILFVRHGATKLNNDDNSVDRIRGWKDIPLSPEGRKATVANMRKVKGAPIEGIVSSDLERAHETAEILSHATGKPVVCVDKGFRPWNVGKFAGQISEKAVPILAQYAQHRPDQKLPDGESFDEFHGRFFSGLHAALGRVPGLGAVVSPHRNERLLKAWAAAGHPADGHIDIRIFNQKGEPTGNAEIMDIPMDRLAAVASAVRPAAERASA